MAVNTNILPEPDDLAGWKAAESVLSKRIIDRIQFENFVTPALFRQYFGCQNGVSLLEKYEDLSVTHAFSEWLVNDYRPVFRRTNKKKKKGKKRHQRKTTTRLGKTLAERMLAEELPAAENRLLEACSQVHPSIFRIVSVAPGVSLTVEDILLGSEQLVHDRMLSGCVQSGLHLTGRVFPVGQFHFFSPIGPPLPNILALKAAEYLESLSVKFTHEGLLREADKFGWLWNWYDRRSTEGYMPQLRNTDGEELVWQTASFSVSDEEAVRGILAERDDIDYDDENDEYLWFRDHGTEAMIPGNTLHLGRIQFVLDELILDVNSVERLNVARLWLEEIPGVKYQGVKTRDLSEQPGNVPMDDRMGPKESVEMTPELVSNLEEMFRKHYMNWLDMPLPILDDKTPRQACKTKAGKQKVAMLIRTIPQPVGNDGLEIDVPREEMLRSLGLESQ